MTDLNDILKQTYKEMTMDNTKLAKQVEGLSAQERIKQLEAQIKAQQAEITEQSKGLFKEAMTELFEENPTLYGFRFTQYTPYFNDGEPCTFRVNVYDIPIWESAEEYASDEDNSWDEGYYYTRVEWERYHKDEPYDASQETKANIQDTVEAILNALDENTMKTMFGDHVRVTVTRSGVDVDEYDHD